MLVILDLMLGVDIHVYESNEEAARALKDGKVRARGSSSYSMRQTDQFSLEVIMHHKMLTSKFRTLDASSANMFYVPYYSRFAQLCNSPK